MRPSPPRPPGDPPADRRPQGDADTPPAAAEDLVVGWLIGTPMSSPSQDGADVACRRCGYVGPMTGGYEDGDLVCPACRMGQRSVPEPSVILVATCPSCGLEIAVLEADRGKTVVCPGCKAFLGCLAPQAVDRPWRRRWNRRA